MRRVILLIVVFCVLLSISSFCAINSLLDRAVTLYKWKYYDDSIVELDKLMLDGKQPWASRAQLLKAHCLIKKGRTADAEDILTKLAKDPDFVLNDYSRFAIAEMYFDAKNYDVAYFSYKDILPESALKGEADLKKAECLYELGDVSAALEIYKNIIAEHSPVAPLDKARLNLGKCYERIGDPRAAMQCYHELNLYHPLSPCLKEGMERINRLSRLHKIYPDAASAEDIFNKAMVFYNFGDFRSALMFFNQIVSNHKSSDLWDDALFKLAMCEYKIQRLKSSITRFKICAANGGKNAPAAQFYLAFAYGKAGYFYQAIDSLSKVITNYPNSEYADEASYYLAYYYEVNGYKDTALKYYESFVNDYPQSEFADDAYWKIGRLSYFNRDYLKAYDSFNKAVERCRGSNMLDACSYWKALCQEKMGYTEDAIKSYQFVISQYDHTYYSFRAREKLGLFGRQINNEEPVVTESLPVGEDIFGQLPMNEEALPFDMGVREDIIDNESLSMQPINIKDHFKKYSELMAIGFYDEAAKEATLLIAFSPEDKKMSAKLALARSQLASGKVRDSIVYAETLCNDSVLSGSYKELPLLTWQLAYPKGYYKHVSQYAAQFGLDEALVLAVIREESRFNPKTTSWANARGLMQIIPQTGRNVARLVGIRGYYTNLLHDPDTNIKMGCYYLAQLIKRFDGNKVYAVAAYNGGPQRIKKWITKWQSEVGENVDLDEFVESIPLSETKRYVQKVMKSFYEYKRLYSFGRYPVITTKS